MSLTFTFIKNLVGAVGNPGAQGVPGAPGRTIYNAPSSPTDATGIAGDFFLNTLTYALTGPKLSNGSWSNAQTVSLVGPQGTQGAQGAQGPAGPAYTLPNDIVANSVMATPISGDAAPVRIGTSNSAGTVTFSADSGGNVTALGTLKVTGAATLGVTTHSGTVTSNTAAGMPSFVSSQGFKSVVPAGNYWLSNSVSSTAWQTLFQPVVPQAQNVAASLMPNVWIAARAGSVTAMSVYAPTLPTNGVTYSLRMTVDSGTGSSTNSQAMLVVNAASTTRVSVPIPKGTANFTFPANAFVYMQVAASSAVTGTVLLQGWFEVELGA